MPDKRFTKCPKCGKSYNGANVYRCSNCERITCYYDGTFGIGSDGCNDWKDHSLCPNCNHKNTMYKIGKVWKY